MAPVYPGSIKTFTNPTSANYLDDGGVPHATQHSDPNDEINAIETTLGTNPHLPSLATPGASPTTVSNLLGMMQQQFKNYSGLANWYTLPASAFATLTGTEVLSNKTLTAPVFSTIVNTGTLTLPTSSDTLLGRATTDTLTNKSLDGNNNTFSNIPAAAIKAEAWTSWTPTYGSVNLTFTSVTTRYARYIQFGKLFMFEVNAVGITGGVSSAYLNFTTPVNARNFVSSVYDGAHAHGTAYSFSGSNYNGLVAGVMTAPNICSVIKNDGTDWTTSVNIGFSVFGFFEAA